jgi:hypothetical protein
MAQPKQSRTPALASLRAPIAAGLCLAGAVILAGPEARANDLMVRYDQSLLVVTGKAFGVTNIIALDAQRNIIQDQRVIVEHDEQRTLVLYRGSLRESYTCTPYCAPTLTIGDDAAYFDKIAKGAQSKANVSVGTAESGAQSSSE